MCAPTGGQPGRGDVGGDESRSPSGCVGWELSRGVVSCLVKLENEEIPGRGADAQKGANWEGRLPKTELVGNPFAQKGANG